MEIGSKWNPVAICTGQGKAGQGRAESSRVNDLAVGAWGDYELLLLLLI